jgi:hypothetical protein
MSSLIGGLILVLLFHLVFLALVAVVVGFFSKSRLGRPARAVIEWLPPFLGGAALRDWAAWAAEQVARKRLASQRTGETVSQLAIELEDAAMQAMLPLADPADLERAMTCPETGQGRVGVTAPEALAIVAYIRKHKSRAEQERLRTLAAENARKISTRSPGDGSPSPCALQGADHVCCVFARRPLRCRPLHALSVMRARRERDEVESCLPGDDMEAPRHEEWVAKGIEIGLTRALKSAGLDANLYELNSALATALGTPDAAERWARGEDVFQSTLRWDQTGAQYLL